MKLGLTTTSRSVPPPSVTPKTAAKTEPLPAPAPADVPPSALVTATLRAAPARAPRDAAAPASDEGDAAKDEPPKAAAVARPREGAPQSAVRRRTPGLRSDGSMPIPTDSSRASPRGRAKPTSRAPRAASNDQRRPSQPPRVAPSAGARAERHGAPPAASTGARAERHGALPAAEAPRKKERNAAETKRRILEAAAAEFAAKGFDGARLGSIARAAGIQQALIHHYFVDKESLHAEVVRGGLEAMTEGAWGLLSQMDAPVADRKGKKRRGPAELRALAEAFVDLLLRFFATNGVFLSILRHEARRDAVGPIATKVVADNVAPVFDAIVARLDEMRARGEVRKDIDARHLVLSCVAMIAFPFQEEPFVTAIWPVDWHRPEHLAERKRDVVEMILARVLP